jgi:hypothetical protein
MSEYDTGVRCEVRGEEAHIDLVYPRNKGHVKRLLIGLECVRAADSILVEYDFYRDGWSIKQHPYIDHGGCSERVGGWQEVAFVEAWALEKDGEGASDSNTTNPTAREP